MLPPSVESALHALAIIATDAELAEATRARWRARGHGGRAELRELPGGLHKAADDLGAELPALTKSNPAALIALLDDPEGEVLLAWCAARHGDGGAARGGRDANEAPRSRDRHRA